jgi:hypothetical protein
MANNPYAPPQAVIGDTPDGSGRPATSPALWNPHAAANWRVAMGLAA